MLLPRWESCPDLKEALYQAFQGKPLPQEPLSQATREEVTAPHSLSSEASAHAQFRVSISTKTAAFISLHNLQKDTEPGTNQITQGNKSGVQLSVKVHSTTLKHC